MTSHEPTFKPSFRDSSSPSSRPTKSGTGGNPGQVSSSSISATSSSSSSGVVIGVSIVSVIVAVGVAVLLYLYCFRKKKTAFEKWSGVYDGKREPGFVRKWLSNQVQSVVHTRRNSAISIGKAMRRLSSHFTGTDSPASREPTQEVYENTQNVLHVQPENIEEEKRQPESSENETIPQSQNPNRVSVTIGGFGEIFRKARRRSTAFLEQFSPTAPRVSEVDGDFSIGGGSEYSISEENPIDVEDEAVRENAAKRRAAKELHAQAAARNRAIILAAETEADLKETSFMGNFFSSARARKVGGARSSFIGSGMNPLAKKKPVTAAVFVEEDVHPPWIAPENHGKSMELMDISPASREVNTPKAEIIADLSDATKKLPQDALNVLNDFDDENVDLGASHPSESVTRLPFQTVEPDVAGSWDDHVQSIWKNTDVNNLHPDETKVGDEDDDININSIPFSSFENFPTKRDDTAMKKVFAKKNPLNKARPLPSKK